MCVSRNGNQILQGRVVLPLHSLTLLSIEATTSSHILKQVAIRQPTSIVSAQSQTLVYGAHRCMIAWSSALY